MTDLLTVPQYESFMGVQTPAIMAFLPNIIPAASRAIERFCDHCLAQNTFTEWMRAGVVLFFPQEKKKLTAVLE